MNVDRTVIDLLGHRPTLEHLDLVDKHFTSIERIRLKHTKRELFQLFKFQSLESEAFAEKMFEIGFMAASFIGIESE